MGGGTLLEQSRCRETLTEDRGDRGQLDEERPATAWVPEHFVIASLLCTQKGLGAKVLTSRTPRRTRKSSMTNASPLPPPASPKKK